MNTDFVDVNRQQTFELGAPVNPLTGLRAGGGTAIDERQLRPFEGNFGNH